jgi:hypothetical protein
MGFAHEHQHPDRDDYITFQCSSLIGYSDLAWEYQYNPNSDVAKDGRLQGLDVDAAIDKM